MYIYIYIYDPAFGATHPPPSRVRGASRFLSSPPPCGHDSQGGIPFGSRWPTASAYMYAYIYIYIHVYINIHVYIYREIYVYTGLPPPFPPLWVMGVPFPPPVVWYGMSMVWYSSVCIK